MLCLCVSILALLWFVFLLALTAWLRFDCLLGLLDQVLMWAPHEGNFEIGLIRPKLTKFSNYREFLCKLKLSMIFLEASPWGCFWIFFCRPPTLSKSESHMILQLQAKVHGLGNLGVLTYTYPIFSWFETPKSDPFLPPSLPHDQYARHGGS